MSAEPLAHMIAVLQPSLAMYLSDSGLGTYPGPEEIRLALADLVADHRSLIDRGAAILEEREVPVPKLIYPLSFTGLHDVDLRHVLPRIVAGLRRQAGELERIAAVADDASAAALAGEALRSLPQHIDSLEMIATKLLAGLSAKPEPPGSGAESSATPPAAS
jgi:hypothetical protein